MSQENKLLTDVQRENFISSCINAFDKNISRINDQKILRVIFDYYENQYRDTSLYDFFTLKNIQENSKDIFTNAIVAPFVMDVTEMVTLAMFDGDETYCDKIIETFTCVIARNKPTNYSFSLINAELISPIAIDKDTLRDFLKNNIWYLVHYLIIMHLEMGTIFSSVVQERSAKK